MKTKQTSIPNHYFGEATLIFPSSSAVQLCCPFQHFVGLLVPLTAEIHARSFVNLYCQYADRHEFEIHPTLQRARVGNSTICYRKKQIDVIFNASFLLLTMNFVITLSK